MISIEAILRDAEKLVALSVQQAPRPGVKLENDKLVLYISPSTDPRYLAYLIADALSQKNLRFGVQFSARRPAKEHEHLVKSLIRPLDLYILAPLRTRYAYYYARSQLTENIAQAIHSLLLERSREADAKLKALGGDDKLGIRIAKTILFYGTVSDDCPDERLCRIIDSTGEPELQVEKLLYEAFREYFIEPNKLNVEKLYFVKEPGYLLLKVVLPPPKSQPLLLYM